MKRLGILFLVLVIALGGIGAAFAAWTDTLTITGTVNTGTVDIVIEATSGTEVYKDLRDDSMAVCYYLEDGVKIYSQDLGYGDPPPGGLLVAWADGNITGDDTMSFEFQNIFPGPSFAVDALFQYVGSVPAKINSITVDPLSDLDGILDDLNPETYAYMWDPNTGYPDLNAPVDIGTQLHKGDWVWAVIGIVVPQDNTLMGKSASGTITIELVQWNEYPYTPGP